MSASCIYEGTVRHRRRTPANEFRHPLALAYIDLGELPTLLGGRLVSARPGLLRFRRADYLGDPYVPLSQAVRDTVMEGSGIAADGPIRVLTQLRSFGHCFNPVSFYYCFASSGDRVQALVAEVTNTPWGERHRYVVAGADGPVVQGAFAKAMHVSPFLGMDQAYRVHAGTPGQTLSIHVENSAAGETVFDATLGLRRRELTPAATGRMIARYPLASLRVLGLIYGHGVGLRLKGAPVHRHPRATRA